MADLYYTGIKGDQILEIAEAISLHLNYLSTSANKKITFDDIKTIWVLGADDSAVPRQIYPQFQELVKLDAQVASQFRRRLLHQHILTGLHFNVYEKIKDKITVLAEQKDIPHSTPAIFVVLPDIMSNSKTYIEALDKGDSYHMENRAKRIFKQVASSPLNEITLELTRAGVDMKQEFKEVRNDLNEVKETLNNKLNQLLIANGIKPTAS